MYLKIIGGRKKYYVTLHPFTSQHGHDAVRFVGDEVPQTDKGFMYYDDDDKEVCDLSAYVYQYRPNEYTTEEDVIVPAGPNNTPVQPSDLDLMGRRISALAGSVSAITPYTDTKKAFYGEKEKVFYGVPRGNASVFFDNYEGGYEISRIDDKLIVSFKEMAEDVTNVSIMIQ